MRLWSQARQMGAYSAKCMTSHTGIYNYYHILRTGCVM